MGFFSDLFGGGDDEEVRQEPLIPPWQLKTGENLANWINKYMNQFVPGETYPGKLTTEMTPYEQQSLSLLDKFIGGQGLGDLFAASKKELMKTLGGEYAQPDTSPYIQAQKKIALRDLEDAVNTMRARRGGAGQYFHTQTQAEESDLTGRTMDYLNNLIGQFLETERGRQFQAAPIAAQLGEYEQFTAPLKTISAAQTYGALPRLIEQGNLENLYQDYLRKRGEQQIPVTMAQPLYGTNVPYGSTTYNQQGPSSFERIMGMVPSLGGLASSLWGGGGLFNIGSLFA